MLTQTMSLTISETRKVVNINGVTVAKKHLAACHPKAKSCEEAVFKYLTIVPFLSEKFEELKDSLKDHTLYCAIKAKRIHKTLNLDSEATIPFMAMCMEKAGDITPEIAEKLSAVTGTTFIHANAENLDAELAKVEDPEDREMIRKIIENVKEHGIEGVTDLSPTRTLH